MRLAKQLAIIWLFCGIAGTIAFFYPPAVVADLGLSRSNFAMLCCSVAGLLGRAAASAWDGGDWFSFDGGGGSESGGSDGGD